MRGTRSTLIIPEAGLIDGEKMGLVGSRTWLLLLSPSIGRFREVWAYTTGFGYCRDNHQRLCLTLGLWNGKDKIIKERLFGLTGNQGRLGVLSRCGQVHPADTLILVHQVTTEKMSRSSTTTSIPPRPTLT